MKPSWCAEAASKAYIDTVKAVKQGRLHESDVAELISAMAAGYGAQLIVEAWMRCSDVSTSVGLSIASRHGGGGRHVCVVPDERSRSEYIDAMGQAGEAPPEVVVGEVEEAMAGLPGVDFVVVDCRRRDFARVLRFAKMSPRGAVLVCKSASSRGLQGFRWRGLLGSGTRVSRSVYLPVGKGVEIARVGPVVSPLDSSHTSRWIKHVDHETGEEHVFRR